MSKAVDKSEIKMRKKAIDLTSRLDEPHEVKKKKANTKQLEETSPAVAATFVDCHDGQTFSGKPANGEGHQYEQHQAKKITVTTQRDPAVTEESREYLGGKKRLSQSQDAASKKRRSRAAMPKEVGEFKSGNLAYGSHSQLNRQSSQQLHILEEKNGSFLERNFPLNSTGASSTNLGPSPPPPPSSESWSPTAMNRYFLAKRSTMQDLDNFMIKNKVTVDELASIIKCTRQTLANWVSGQFSSQHDQSVTLLLARFLAEEMDFEGFYKNKSLRETTRGMREIPLQEKASRFKEEYEKLRTTKWTKALPKVSGNGNSSKESKTNTTNNSVDAAGKGISTDSNTDGKVNKEGSEPLKKEKDDGKFSIVTCMSEAMIFQEALRLCCLFQARKVEKRTLESYWRAYHAVVFGLLKILQGFAARVKDDEFVIVPLQMLLVTTMCVCSHLTLLHKYHSNVAADLFTKVCLAWRRALLTIETQRPVDLYAQIEVPSSQERAGNDQDEGVGTSPSWLSLQDILLSLDNCIAQVEIISMTELGWTKEFFEREAGPLLQWIEHFLC